MPPSRFCELYDLRGPVVANDRKCGNRVVYSALRSGEAHSQGDGLAIKYVHSGTERYNFKRSSIAVRPAQMLIVPRGLASEVSIKREEERPTIGICLFFDVPIGEAGVREFIEGPVLLPAENFALGHAIAQVADKLARQAQPDASIAEALLDYAEHSFEDLAADIGDAVDALSSARQSTRWSLYRRLSAARAYLHDVLDRPVALDELARHAGISQFQFARDFRSCFGIPPAKYHRTIRLEAARRELDRGELSCMAIAHKFGFADASSFGRAYRARFGHSPVRSLQR